jgi:hypothetical protein
MNSGLLPGNKLPGKYSNPAGVQRVPKGLGHWPSISIGGTGEKNV